uniref:Uncharacterized protein n=1 Tax=Avena sativa TaxID=4498 RepID=A0ACD5T9I8_AVESA
MHNNRVAADDGDGGGVGEIVEAVGGLHDRVGPLGRKTARFTESVVAPPGGSDDGDDNEDVKVTLHADAEGNVLSMADPADSDATQEKRPSSSYGHGVLRVAMTPTKPASHQVRRLTAFRRPRNIDRSNSAAMHALRKLEFIARTADGPKGRAAAESCFEKEARNGLLHRSKFAKCIGMKELEFADELFDALSRRRNIFGDSINKEQLLDFWDQITGTSFDNRLQTFFDMVDKNADGRISKDEIEAIITLSASANKLTMSKERCHEYALLTMEEMDPYNVGYIELDNLERLLLQTPSESMRIRTNKRRELSEAPLLCQLPRPTEEPNPFQRWHRRARYLVADNWRRCWVMLLWLGACAGLFGWKFAQYRRRAVFEVMGYCVCVAKGGAETLKFNMALVLLPVCRNTITLLRSRTAVGRLVPFDHSLGFHKVVAAGIAVGVALHAVSHLACDFPRLLRATDGDYEAMKPFFGDAKPRNYWWFVKGTEGWTGLAMLALMAIAFTLALPWFRRRGKPLPLPAGSGGRDTSRNAPFVHCLTGSVDGLLNRFTGYSAFWYTHHLFVVVYALLLVHGHFLYLTNEWQKKTTWMYSYLAVPIVIYACERVTRTLRSRVRTVRKLKVAVHPEPASMSLHFPKPQGFKYKSGQYIFVKCPAVSAFQWHPFSITSAPHDDYVSVHIRTRGGWTKDLKDVFSKDCPPQPKEGAPVIFRAEYDRDGTISNTSFPKLLIDGPYGAPAQDYKKYDVVLLVGLGIGATPMISIIKDIINNMKRLDRDVESGGAGASAFSPDAFRTRQAYFYWVTREQESFDWFRGVLDEVTEADTKGAIELHNHCSSVYEEGDARSALISMLQSLNHAKQGVDLVTGARVKTHFGRPDWPQVYKRIAGRHDKQTVGQSVLLRRASADGGAAQSRQGFLDQDKHKIRVSQ